MADSKISALTDHAANPADTDLFVIVDVSDTTMAASGTNKKLAASYLATRAGTETHTNKTFVTPTIASFVNANHTHADAAGGGTLSGYLAITGATTGATSQAQTFTSGVISTTAALSVSVSTPVVKAPSSDLTLWPSTGVVRFTNGSGVERGYYNAGNETWDISPLPDSTAASAFRFFRFTNTSGTKSLGFYKGDNTSTLIHQIGINAITRFNAQSDDIDFNIRGDTDTNLFYLDASVDSIGIGVGSPTAKLHMAASTTTRASFRIPSGSAPTTPNAGDIWNDGALTFYEANSTTNDVVNSLVLRRASTGTPAAGFGAGFRVGLASSTTANQDAGRLTFAWNVATHASRAATGKLTAYYISTERDMITWTAASTAASSLVSLTGRVGINETSPGYSLHITGDNSSTFSLIKLQNTQGSGKSYWLYSGAAEAGGFGVYNETDARYAIFVDADGNTGIGNIIDPRSILHAHDGSGGCIFINRSGVGGTLVTVIPDATGDVTENISFVGWVSNSVPFTAQVTDQYLAVSSSTTVTDGTNTLTIAVTAAGAFTLQATAGAATWKVCLWAFWR